MRGKSTVGGLILKVVLLIVIAGLLFAAWRHHTTVAPGKAVIGFMNSAIKNDNAGMKKYVTKASAKLLGGAEGEGGSGGKRVTVAPQAKIRIKSVNAGFSRGTVQGELTFTAAGVSGSVPMEYRVVREGLSWKVDLKAMMAPSRSEEQAE